AGIELIRRLPSLPPVGLGPGTLTASIRWNLWISRNQLTFQKRAFTPEETLAKAISEAREWTLAQTQPTNPIQIPVRDKVSLLRFSAGIELIRRLPSLPPVGLGPGTLTASIRWHLWISRNQLTFQKRAFIPEETLAKAISEAREWTLAQTPLRNPIQIPPSINQDPSLGTATPHMYTYAAWSASIGCAGLGWIIDDTGSSSSHSATATFVKSPLIAETLAMRKAMTSAIDKGINSLLILSDSQTLIKLLNSKGRNLEIAGPLNDIYLLSTFFNNI
ncbi:hypothetical protein F2Q69_00032292, partial [Brassica cretica]